jgi:hypothetical protein
MTLRPGILLTWRVTETLLQRVFLKRGARSSRKSGKVATPDQATEEK